MLSNSRLWIVATPLGNPGDLSPRATRLLIDADIVLAEDTRRAARLFQSCGLPKRAFESYFEHNESEKLQTILKQLRDGKTVVLISDAGTPLLSDPGYRLVRACRESGIEVSPVPGPNAPAAALSAAGLPPIPFSFLGFLPRDAAKIKSLFQNFSNVPGSLIFFERRDRLRESLMLAHEIFGSREMAICRELTKIHEEFILGNLADYENLCSGVLGEITIIIGPGMQNNRTGQEDVLSLLRTAKAGGMKNRDAARAVAEKVRGWNVGELYSMLCSARDEKD